ncbi:MAG: hypothetical protein M1818_001521 [Claussenomyces sp. TS43310]|nr:MAG: hypothetical protein M1818_001521 [Claussenomyces sp. TS43310]
MAKQSNQFSAAIKPKGSLTEPATSAEVSRSDAATSAKLQAELARSLTHHLRLLQQLPTRRDLQEFSTAPVFTTSVFNHAELLSNNDSQAAFPQYGLIAGLTNVLDAKVKEGDVPEDPRVFFNVAAPSSVFICGSQGSGKSHTLSCLLENCLLASSAGKLPKPLTGIVFHYDTFISDDGGSPCEAAFLSSNPNIKVRVLCAQTNVRTIQHTYHALNVQIEPLEIDQKHLNTKRMLDLMAVSKDDGPMPLYLHAVNRILREMRIAQQSARGAFNYNEFRRRIMDADLTPGQLGPLQQRLDTLESFMVKQTPNAPGTKNGKQRSTPRGNDWSSKPGCLTIVDLSCPCVTPEGACSLFNICLSIFLEQGMSCGRVVALDEAHKYMNKSAEATSLTETLLATVRLQRHLGARVFISTQEPTISSALMDLSSVTIVHRFTSPEWLNSLKAHLAGVSSILLDALSIDETADQDEDEGVRKASRTAQIFNDVLKLQTGEALLFSPSAIVGLHHVQGKNLVKRLGADRLKVRIRTRLTADGGMSVMAA